MNGYNFTERTKKVLALAREEAAALHYEYIGTEHILLGVIREGEGVACTMLVNLNVDLDELRQAILTAMKPSKGTLTGPDLPYTSRAKKVIELSMAEAQEVHHSYVGTEHVLLGLLREEKGLAAQVLESFGVTTENARAEMRRVLGEPFGDESSPRAGAAPTTYIPQYPARLTEVLAAAHAVATRRQRPTVTDVHLAIALLEHDAGAANAALDRLGLNRADALAALLELAPMGDSTVGPDDVTHSAALIYVLHLMEQIQREARATAPGTHDLLLAILDTSPDVAGLLERQSIDATRLRDEIRRISG